MTAIYLSHHPIQAFGSRLGRLGRVPGAGGVKDFDSGGRQACRQAGAGWEAGRQAGR